MAFLAGGCVQPARRKEVVETVCGRLDLSKEFGISFFEERVKVELVGSITITAAPL